MVASPPGAVSFARSLLVTELHLDSVVRRLVPLPSSSLGASLLFRRLRVQLRRRWRGSHLRCFLRRVALVSLQPEVVAVAAVALLAVV